MVRYELDPAHTNIGFSAKHLAVTTVHGHFSRFETALEGPDDDPTRVRGTVKIDVSSLDTRNEQRDAHLRSNDFLAIDEHPEITFVSTEVAPVESDGALVLRVTGDLTIKGVTRPVTVDFTYEGAAVDPFGNQRIGFEGSVVINRKDWGVNWNAALEAGGVLVSEKVTLEFELSAIKSA